MSTQEYHIWGGGRGGSGGGVTYAICELCGRVCDPALTVRRRAARKNGYRRTVVVSSCGVGECDDVARLDELAREVLNGQRKRRA